jgi:anti-sigma-K factor RskA
MMSGTPAHPGMEAKVYWNKQTKQAMVAIDTLPMNPQGMQYELWAINDKGTPVAEGVFDAGTKDMLLMKQVDNATAFAVTLEKQGGVDSPTMSQMYVMGKVNS